MEKEPITAIGLEKLKSELDELKNVRRPKIISAIAEARAHGDLKENAEYHAAREQQAQTESKIIEIGDTIARANVIDITKLDKSDKVVFGCTVEVVELENSAKKTYKIVGKAEADINQNLIYFRSPIGKAMIGKSTNSIVSVNTPSGERNFEILSVEYV